MGDIIAGIDVVEPLPGEAVPPIEGNYGLNLPSGDGQTFAWVCHEALTEEGAVRAPRYVRNGDGIWLAALSDVTQGRGGNTLFRSPDGGCSWNVVGGIEAGVQIRDAQFDGADAARAIAVSDTPDTGNGVWLSDDAGASWSVSVPAAADRLFHSAGFLDGRGWATATNAAGSEAYWWSQDAEGTWSESIVDVGGAFADARFAGLATEGEQVWAVIDPLGDDTLLHSDDRGASWSVVLSGSGTVNDAARVGGAELWVVLNAGLELVRIADADGAVTPLRDHWLSFGIAATDEAVWYAPLSVTQGAMLARSGLDGAGQEVLAFPDDVVGPLDCPAGTEQAEVCAPLWPTLAPMLRGFDVPPGETGDSGYVLIDDPFADGTDERGCGCGGGSAAAAMLAPLLLLGLRRW